MKRDFVPGPFFSLDIVPDDGNDCDDNDDEYTNDVDDVVTRQTCSTFWGEF